MFYYRIDQEIKGNHRKTSQYNQHIEPQGHLVIITSNKALNKASSNKEKTTVSEKICFIFLFKFIYSWQKYDNYKERQRNIPFFYFDDSL